jgi:hypothetical protein
MPSQRFIAAANAPTEAPMSRDELIIALQTRGAFSLIQTIEDVAAGRRRRVFIHPVSGEPALTREAVELLRCLGGEVELPVPAIRSRLRRAG